MPVLPARTRTIARLAISEFVRLAQKRRHLIRGKLTVVALKGAYVDKDIPCGKRGKAVKFSHSTIAKRWRATAPGANGPHETIVVWRLGAASSRDQRGTNPT